MSAYAENITCSGCDERDEEIRELTAQIERLERLEEQDDRAYVVLQDQADSAESVLSEVQTRLDAMVSTLKGIEWDNRLRPTDADPHEVTARQAVDLLSEVAELVRDLSYSLSDAAASA